MARSSRPPELEVGKHFAGDRIQGARTYQEDDYGWDNHRSGDFLMVLADGMGGHQGGDVASTTAIETFVEQYDLSAHTGISISQRLLDALHQTNQELARKISHNPEMEGMGCTFLGVVCSRQGSQERLEWVSVGDSPLWLYRAGRLTQINADHSMKPVLENEVENKQLTATEAKYHPERNMLRSALMGEHIELIDLSKEPMPIYPGDSILLASDGVLSLSDDNITEILSHKTTAQDMVDALLSKITELGKKGQDNSTVIVLHRPRLEASKTPAKAKKYWLWTLFTLGLVLLGGFIWWKQFF
ncbi:PP2C family protein-serine/threonine phosphatase [Candidatus Venteria ishoeyi]|uniref:Serine/threonine phosphatase stp n=1 Tax=Candidatus Venteria ishoeyi TaxID=1899563 RepID=A0A1H6F5P7_9GAMM|nr:protein phosphatase 2C domain-containing protein [Candidatus Venteria ishoeyi]SEH04883.1 Serine/threonine phosphatase stp [Candidatus Venteria ishoeyi]